LDSIAEAQQIISNLKEQSDKLKKEDQAPSRYENFFIKGNKIIQLEESSAAWKNSQLDENMNSLLLLLLKNNINLIDFIIGNQDEILARIQLKDQKTLDSETIK